MKGNIGRKNVVHDVAQLEQENANIRKRLHAKELEYVALSDEMDGIEEANAELRQAQERLITEWKARAEALANEVLNGDAQHFYRNGQRWSLLQAANELAALTSPAVDRDAFDRAHGLPTQEGN